MCGLLSAVDGELRRACLNANGAFTLAKCRRSWLFWLELGGGARWGNWHGMLRACVFGERDHENTSSTCARGATEHKRITVICDEEHFSSVTVPVIKSVPSRTLRPVPRRVLARGGPNWLRVQKRSDADQEKSLGTDCCRHGDRMKKPITWRHARAPCACRRLEIIGSA